MPQNRPLTCSVPDCDSDGDVHRPFSPTCHLVRETSLVGFFSVSGVCSGLSNLSHCWPSLLHTNPLTNSYSCVYCTISSAHLCEVPPFGLHTPFLLVPRIEAIPRSFLTSFRRFSACASTSSVTLTLALCLSLTAEPVENS
jgi:hypothetical protein